MIWNYECKWATDGYRVHAKAASPEYGMHYAETGLTVGPEATKVAAIQAAKDAVGVIKAGVAGEDAGQFDDVAL